jgi:SAM-dependent methyltransferase
MEKFTYQQMHHDEKVFWWYVARRKILQNTLESLVESKVRLLEVGSGTGGNYELLSQFGTYTGIEKEPMALELARGAHPDANYIECEVPQQLNILSDEYDMVALLDVIEHVNDDVETLKQIKKLLTEKGQILLTTPAFPFLWSAHDKVHHHYRRYTKKQLFKVCGQAGLKIEYHSYFNFLLFPLAVVVKLLNTLRRSKKPHSTKIPKVLNWIFEKTFSLESRWIPKRKLPVGVSHLVVLSKIEDEYAQRRNPC